MTMPASRPNRQGPESPVPLRQKGPIAFRTLGRNGPLLARADTLRPNRGWGIAAGLIAIATGLCALLDSGATLRGMTILIGTSQTAQGAMSIIGSWRMSTDRKNRTRQLITGILLIAAGISGLLAADAHGLALSSGLWFLIVAVQDFLDARKTPPARGWKIALGVVTGLSAVFILTHPDLTLQLIARYVGISLICRGALQLTHLQYARPVTQL